MVTVSFCPDSRKYRGNISERPDFCTLHIQNDSFDDVTLFFDDVGELRDFLHNAYEAADRILQGLGKYQAFRMAGAPRIESKSPQS